MRQMPRVSNGATMQTSGGGKRRTQFYAYT